MKRQVSYNIDEDVIEEIRGMAEKAGWSASRLVEHILKGALDSRREVLRDLDSIDLVDLVKKLKRVVKSKVG